ncbi:DHH family phosphoesterase [Methylomicrobium sp. Wu6]|uniref:DHH family phosphoesterase n=1 Tax=Methylomicrobium sp. Wu6 TaxID=3107928 RepID=UPI002DD657E7|nr:DHH family phosphoesterase [Methylomicrobium sp. Wu6]MEC4749865.1 DHHA1 domain-containing protein [Methylomicrobium sp. Wu6]
MNVIFYHKNCLDGLAAAWAVWRHFKQNSMRTRHQGVRYDEAMPEFDDGDDLFIVDFSYSPAEIVEAAKKARTITLIDHHITAQTAHEAYWATHPMPENVCIHFSQDHSGCVLAWQHFNPEKTVPRLLSLIEDHDLWRFNGDSTKAVLCALHSQIPISINTLDGLMRQESIEELETLGGILLEQRQRTVLRLKGKQHWITFGDAKGLAVNAPSEFSNELGHELAKESGTFGVSYQFDGTNQRWFFAIRSSGDYDVGAIAQRYGGGGHKNAAGFSVNLETFFRLMEEACVLGDS